MLNKIESIECMLNNFHECNFSFNEFTIIKNSNEIILQKWDNEDFKDKELINIKTVADETPYYVSLFIEALESIFTVEYSTDIPF